MNIYFLKKKYLHSYLLGTQVNLKGNREIEKQNKPIEWELLTKETAIMQNYYQNFIKKLSKPRRIFL